jgi:cell division septation protein DedD
VGIPVPARRLPPVTRLAPPALAALERVWPKRLGIAAMFAALIALAVGVYQWPTLSSRFRQTQPPTDIAAVPPVQPTAEETASQPATPPVSEPSAAAAEYFVTVGLYVSRPYANVVVNTLTTAGLPAIRRAIELRGEAFEQVVLGPFHTRDEAATSLQHLRELGGPDDAQVIEVRPTP